MPATIRRPWPAAITVLAVLPALSRAHAEPVSTSTTAPYSVVVKAPAPSSHPDPSQRSTRIGEVALERARARSADVPDLIDLVSGARVLDLGGPLHERRLSLRGAAATGTAFIVDDVPLSSPFATGLDLGLVPLEGVSELSVVHGGAGALYGSGALGGVVLLRTRPAKRRPSSASLALGSLETVRLRGSVSGDGLSAAGAYEQSRGDFEYVSRLEGLPDLARLRSNNDVRRGLLSTSYEHEVGSGRIELTAGGAAREAGVPGFETQADLDARELRFEGRTRVAYVRNAEASRPMVQVAAHLQGLGIGYEDEERPEGSRTLFWASGIELGLGASEGSSHRWSGRLQLGLEHSSSTEHGEQSRPRLAVALADELPLGPFVLFGALRSEAYGGQRVQLLPRAGVSFSPLPSLELGLAAGRSFRVPTIDELHHPTQAGLSGNPALIAETGWDSELFARLSILGIELELGAFVRRTEDLILYLNRNAFEIRPENVGTANLVGLESSARFLHLAGPVAVELAIAGSLMAGALEETDTPWPTLAPNAASGELVLSGFGLELSTRLRHVASTFANLSGTLATEPYLRWDAAVVLHPMPEASLAFSMNNLLDRRDLETVNKLPLPGRTFLFAVRVREEVL